MSATPGVSGPHGPEVTRWLQVLGSDAGAVPPQAVYRLLYDELHRRARGYMRKESPEHTLSATGLVHEAWMRMSEQNRTEWRDRGHFIAVASTMMRRILVDHAVAKRADKRAADLQPLSTTLLDREGSSLDRDVVAVHDALLAFETVDARAAKVVELRYFGGLELEEIGEALGVSLATIKRDWAVARAWLRRELGG
jgi:RNA polymerase sigma-70 factor, ECF subfamily